MVSFPQITVSDRSGHNCYVFRRKTQVVNVIWHYAQFSNVIISMLLPPSEYKRRIARDLNEWIKIAYIIVRWKTRKLFSLAQQTNN